MRTRATIFVAHFLVLDLAACTGPMTAGPTDSEDPTPTSEYGVGTYRVGSDILPGIYAGKAGTGIRESCYWARLRGASGMLEDIIANDNAVGQFYIEVLSTDALLEIRCSVTAFADWPAPASPASDIGPGTYIVGRDISSGTFRGKAGADILDSCYWARLRGVSGELSDIIANDNAKGQYFVEVAATDFALHTACALEKMSE